ncbi:MAG: hypothetical protein V7L02_03160 [Nostoc sp.]|uniref:hypothetical protein n=1 Tax=Nostoc sp. TaxID=1180 RepID=UPI002FF7CB1F
MNFRDAINRRLYNNQSFVETAIYRVSCLNRTVIKVQVDTTKVQVDAIKVQVDATKVQVDATKVQVDATKVQGGFFF